MKKVTKKATDATPAPAAAPVTTPAPAVTTPAAATTPKKATKKAAAKPKKAAAKKGSKGKKGGKKQAKKWLVIQEINQLIRHKHSFFHNNKNLFLFPDLYCLLKTN